MLRFLRNSWDLWIVLFMTPATIGIVQVSTGPNLLRTLLATVFIFICPGYAFTSALFGRSLTGLHLLTLTLGMSMALAVGSGIVLHLSPWGLQTVTWVILTGVITVCSTTLALLRRVRTTVPSPAQVSPFFHGLRLRHVLGFCFTLLIATGGLVIARQGAVAQQSTYTQFWIQREGDTPNAFRVGIRSREAGTVYFNLEVKFGNTIVQDWREIVLRPDETWESQMQIPSALFDINSKVSEVVSATLYRLEDSKTLYRFVTLRLESKP